ncbi:hypothetical protein BGY98DRAFT_66916 [Russula aff. rugulosa BPL654]|nr:hypothetical protein BGY98DRAFT_66916 [Russula aff. rugulosa BPL654]
MGCVSAERDPIEYAFSFCSSTQRRMRSGHVPFRTDGDLEDSGLVRETRSVWVGSAHKTEKGGVAVPTSKGGKAKGARGIPNSPVTVLRPEACRDNIFSPFAGNLALRPGECRSSHSISRDAFSCHGSISQQYCVLDHRFPLLVTLFVIIGLPFLFSHTRRSSSLSLSSLSIASTRG